jgi:hypothetical protein
VQLAGHHIIAHLLAHAFLKRQEIPNVLNLPLILQPIASDATKVITSTATELQEYALTEAPPAPPLLQLVTDGVQLAGHHIIAHLLAHAFFKQV